MNYEKRLTIPPETTATAPVTAEMEIHPGIIQLVSVYFPPGCCGLAHLQVKLWERVLWPTNPNADFIGDDVLIEFPEDLEIVDPPFILTLVGWNEDDTFPHTPIFRVQITPADKSLRSVLDRLSLGPTGPLTPVGG